MLSCDAAPARRLQRRRVTLPPVRPNEGIRAAYHKRLDALLAEMHNSLTHWLSAGYRREADRIALDRSPAQLLQKLFARLSRRWLSRFGDLAKDMAKQFTGATQRRTDAAMLGALKKAGFIVKFTMTTPMRNAYHAVAAQQVGLIKSIATQHLAEVQGLVMRSVQAGRDLGTLSEALQERYVVSKSRAALIALHQSNMASATFTRVRQQELGIERAIWRHSHAGRRPRPEHVAADGQEYDVAKGMFLEGVWTWPGVEINCRCVSEAVMP